MKSYSHSYTAKIIAFIIVIVCFTGAITSFVNTVILGRGNFDIIYEDNYYESLAFRTEAENITRIVTRLALEYKSEENIKSGATIDENEISVKKEDLFYHFTDNSKEYNPNLSEEENHEIFKEVYEDKILEAKNRIINEDLKEYRTLLRKLENYKGVMYYASDGESILTNSKNMGKGYFKSFPSYFILDRFEEEVYPKDIERNTLQYWLTKNNDYYYSNGSNSNEIDSNDNAMYIAFSDEFLNPRIETWKEDKVAATNSIYRTGGFLLGLVLSFLYLILIIGRRSCDDKQVHLNSVDRIYNDINLVLCAGLITLWFALLQVVQIKDIHKIVIPITGLIAPLGLILVLSLVKHFKNKTFLKHTAIYGVFQKLFSFVQDIYSNGSIGIKIAVIIIGYPILAAATFFMFPITIGIALWLANNRVKEFIAIKNGVERIKEGDIHHEIKIKGEGEFSKLASDINSITEGLNKAVDNELKSERLKTELITNVSHDIRTPLTSIITYVDLLKKEEDKSQAEKYIDVIDQKSQRLKILTEDLFEAAKASSGSIPVQKERIDITSLITQGIGELNHKIEESQLEFKINQPKDKIYINADGKLLWRAIENLLSNIFKYALKESRVYIDIKNVENELVLTIKNISAYELNISSEELMERFKRGDEARSSQGSGLGLSIAKSLIEVQKGSFDIDIDGDLFKATIRMPITD